MEEDKQEITPPRGNEWEVVSLTASAYAAAPSSEASDSANENKDKDLTSEELGSSQMMSKSEFEHLVFPPSEHEDLPVESDNSDGHSHEPVLESEIDKHDIDDDKIQEQLNEPSLSDSGELDRAKFFEKGKTLSEQKTEFEKKDSQGIEGKDSVYQGHVLKTYPSDSIISETVALDQNTEALNCENPSVQNLGTPSNLEENIQKNNSYSGPLCDDWWKKQAASLYARTKEADVYWSIFIAASIVGLVFIGKKWRSGGFSNVDKTRSWFLSFVCST